MANIKDRLGALDFMEADARTLEQKIANVRLRLNELPSGGRSQEGEELQKELLGLLGLYFENDMEIASLRKAKAGYNYAKEKIEGRLIESDEFGSNHFSESRAAFLSNLTEADGVAQEVKNILAYYIPTFAAGLAEMQGLAWALHEMAIRSISKAASQSADRHFWLSLEAAVMRDEARILELYRENQQAEHWAAPSASDIDFGADEGGKQLRELNEEIGKRLERDAKGMKVLGVKVGIKKVDEREAEAVEAAQWLEDIADDKTRRRAATALIEVGEDATPERIAFVADSSTKKAVGGRIRRWRMRVGLRPAEVADKLGVKVQAISNWENGHALPSEDNIKMMARLFNIRPRYLEFGIDEAEAIRMAHKEKVVSAREHEFIEVPLYDDIKVAAGDGDISFVGDEQETKPLAFRRDFFTSRGLDRTKAKCLRVGGDSMSPYLQDGDVVLIQYEPGTRVKDGHCYAIRYGQGLRIKRLKVRLDGGLDLISDNDKYDVEVVRPDEMQYVTVLGEVRWRAG